MSGLQALTPAERARHLGNPAGEIGIAIANSLNVNNKVLYDLTLPRLALAAGDHVLEIGFGNGRFVADTMLLADRLKYCGIDISSTMLDEATRFNAALIADGTASFQLASADKIPFGDNHFDKVFAIGVLHFWRDPAVELAEIRRVLRNGGLSVMIAIDPQSASAIPHARPEYGFHLKDADTLAALHREAGFDHVIVEIIESPRTRPDGSSFINFTDLVVATA